MSDGEMIYLVGVVLAMVVFAGSLFWASTTVRR